jgi:hypothetical protein
VSQFTTIPNGPFYSAQSNFLQSPLGPLVIGTGLSVTADGTVLAASGAGGTVTAVTAGAGLSGGTITTTGTLSLGIASAATLGGIKVGSNLTIAADGTLSAPTPTGGTITGVTPGTGLSGGGSSGNVTLSITAAGVGLFGGVSIGSGINVAAGTISVPAASTGTAGSVALATSAEVITGTDGTKAVTPAALAAKVASTVAPGIVQLSDSVATNDSTVAATQTAAKTAYDVAVSAQTVASAALPATGGTMTGAIAFDASQTFPPANLPVATTSSLGAIQVGSGLAIDGAGVLSAITGTVAAVTAGPGLGAPVTGNTITSSGTITLLPPTGTSLGGVKAGANISIGADGTISVPSAAFILTNNPYAYNNYVWPTVTGTNNQVLTLTNGVTGQLAWVDSGVSLVSGTGISITTAGTTSTISLEAIPSLTAGGFGGTALIPTFTINSYGQIISAGEANPFAPFQNADIAALDFTANATNREWTLTGNTTVANPTNAVSGQSGSLIITQDATTPYTITWGSAWKFAGGAAYAGNPVAAAVDMLEFVVVAGNYIVVTNIVSDIG